MNRQLPIRSLLFAVALAFVSQSVFAQQMRISGRVCDSSRTGNRGSGCREGDDARHLDRFRRSVCHRRGPRRNSRLLVRGVAERRGSDRRYDEIPAEHHVAGDLDGAFRRGRRGIRQTDQAERHRSHFAGEGRRTDEGRRRDERFERPDRSGAGPRHAQLLRKTGTGRCGDLHPHGFDLERRFAAGAHRRHRTRHERHRSGRSREHLGAERRFGERPCSACGAATA